MNAPLSLFPFAQARINAMLEDADEERAAADNRWADHLIEKARAEAQATRQAAKDQLPLLAKEALELWSLI